jgi:hypothetical protein
MQYRVDEIGCDLGERTKHKPALMKPRMGQYQKFTLHPYIAKKEYVEIDSAGFI